MHYQWVCLPTTTTRTNELHLGEYNHTSNKAERDFDTFVVAACAIQDKILSRILSNLERGHVRTKGEDMLLKSIIGFYSMHILFLTLLLPDTYRCTYRRKDSACGERGRGDG